MAAAKVHGYGVVVIWEGNQGAGTSAYTSYGRRFRVEVEGKPDLAGSADPAFRGDPSLHNPEELLVAAVASCHMLFYLSLCARSGVTVVRYRDAAEGILEILPGGGGKFGEITLHPRVTLSRGSDPEAAAALHARAGELCFIASSCNFPIRHQAEIEIES
jgi:organic hydroperoxide reductase OsmC/OhrA